MALPQLLEALREQATARRASVLARADQAARDIRARCRVELEQRRADLVSGARREAEEAAQRAASTARTEGAELVLVARAKLLERVQRVLEDRIQRATEVPEYLEFLRDEVSDALERLPSGPVVLRARPDLVSRISEACKGREDARVEPVEGMGVGFTASSPRHGVEVDATLETRLRFAWPRLAVGILAEIES